MKEQLEHVRLSFKEPKQLEFVSSDKVQTASKHLLENQSGPSTNFEVEEPTYKGKYHRTSSAAT